jgi:hypothetical protein
MSCREKGSSSEDIESAEAQLAALKVDDIALDLGTTNLNPYPDH